MAVAEIERLKKFLDMCRKVSLARRDQNIRKDELMIKMSAEYKTAKAEAIKEFLDKASGFVVVNVPVSMFNLEYGKDVELFSDVIRVKHLLKIYQEMVGEQV